MTDLNTTTVVVAVIAALGTGGLGREIFSGLRRIGRGVAVRESTRKVDIVTERDRALQREQDAVERADRADRNRWRTENWAAGLERRLILAGIDYPGAPVLEDTITTAQPRPIEGGSS